DRIEGRKLMAASFPRGIAAVKASVASSRERTAPIHDGSAMPDGALWDYVFSPQAMLYDGLAGLISGVLFWVVIGHPARSLKAWCALALIGSVLRHTLPGAPHARTIPSGHVGLLATLCMREASEEQCFCAVDALKERIGETALVQLGVRAEVNIELPTEFLDVLAECPAYTRDTHPSHERALE